MEIVEAVQTCKAELSDLQIATAMLAAKWRNVTPSVGGQSMATITGATQYRRGSDEALVSGHKSMAGPNCQFDFHKTKPEIDSQVIARLDEALAPHTEDSSGMLEWKQGEDSYSLKRRSSDTLTMLWLPLHGQEGKN